MLPLVSGITRVNPDPTGTGSVAFSVTFSEFVVGVGAADFATTITGGISGQSITSVVGSGALYTVTVNTGSGGGTLRLDVLDDDSIRDAVNKPLGGSGVGNGIFTSGPTYTVIVPPGAFQRISPVEGAEDLNTNLKLVWEGSGEADGYEYCYDTSNDDACEGDNWVDVGMNTSVSLSGMEINTDYWWQVRAYNEAGQTLAHDPATQEEWGRFATGLNRVYIPMIIR
jgi:hypothetical protein